MLRSLTKGRSRTLLKSLTMGETATGVFWARREKGVDVRGVAGGDFSRQGESIRTLSAAGGCY